MNDFGTCPYCGGILHPVWFTEDEYKVYEGRMYKTGRTRRNISHLVCEDCLKNQCIDDSYAGRWH